MASIRKRSWTSPDGEAKSAWAVTYTDTGGKRRQKTFQRKKDAESWLADTLHNVKAGTHVADSASVSVETAGKAWIDRGKEDGLEASTLRQYEGHLRHYILPELGTRRLSQITVPTVTAFARTLRDKGLSDATARKVVSSLGAIFAEAQEMGWAATNPVKDMRKRRRGTAADRHRDSLQRGRDIPTQSEIKAILQAADAKGGMARALMTTAIFTGLRASELRGLPWSAVDFARKTLEVRQRADDQGVIGPPKSEAGRRTVPLAPRVLNALREWKLACPSPDLVFPNGRGRVEFNSNLTKRIVGPVQVAAGVVNEAERHKYGIHAFRHFFASWLLAEPENGGQGMQPKRAQVLLGHSTIAMTMDTYGHLLPAREDEAQAFAAAEAALLQ